MRLPAPARLVLREAAARAAELGLPLFLVGGAVRDGLLGLATRDLDLVTEGDPAPLARALTRRFGGEGRDFGRFGTARLALPQGVRVDIARARAETYARPGALPEVRPASLREDLFRRDFTVNSMALALRTRGPGDLVDPFGGAKDLRARRLRALHPASFRDDPTRLFRGARYAGRFGLRPEPLTRGWIAQAVSEGHAGALSRERVRQELVRLLEESDPGPALRLAGRWGLWPSFHPDFRWPEAAAAGRGAVERLGVAVLAMPGGKGAELLRALPLERASARVLESALELARAARAPRGPLDPAAARIVALARPGLPPAALKPRLARGTDLVELGLSPGPEFSRWLDWAAAAQWRGEFSTRAGARAWLRRGVGK